LATEIQGGVQHSIVQHDDHLLAQQQHERGNVAATLMATDQQRSVLSALDTNLLNPLAYSPYGHRSKASGLLSLLGFNGQRPDPVTGHYHLGNGYRQYNPVLMRFNSPDSWSPFGEGGLNAYAYCAGEPVLGSDPTGHSNVFTRLLKGIGNIFGRSRKLKTPRNSVSELSKAPTRSPANSKPSSRPASYAEKPAEIRPFDFDAAYKAIARDEANQALAKTMGHKPKTMAGMENAHTDFLASKLPAYEAAPAPSSTAYTESFVEPLYPPPRYAPLDDIIHSVRDQ
jgi:RHS repeat-associated protein